MPLPMFPFQLHQRCVSAIVWPPVAVMVAVTVTAAAAEVVMADGTEAVMVLGTEAGTAVTAGPVGEGPSTAARDLAHRSKGGGGQAP